MISWFSKIFLTFFLLAPVLSYAGSRDNLFYQGVLFTADGVAVTGTVILHFRIYEESASGSPLWDEEQEVNVDDGLYSAELGSQTPFPSDLFQGYDSLFLGVQVNDDSEMSPRLGLFSVPFAQQAEVAVTAMSLADQVVTSSALAPGAVVSGSIAADAVGAAEMASSGVTPGTYFSATITVDADGRITSAANGSVAIAHTHADADIPNNITIDLALAAKSLAANGTNCPAGQFPLGVDASGNVEGCTAVSNGTVTSVGSGMGLTGGPVTGSGTLDIGVGTGIAVNADDVQLNYAGTLAGNPTLTAGQAVFDAADNANNGGLLFEGATADNFEGLLTLTDPTADQTWTLPNASGTIALTTSSISGNATTATALAANGTNCSAGQYALGTDASGNAEGCTAAGTGTITAINTASGSGLSGGVSSGDASLQVVVDSSTVEIAANTIRVKDLGITNAKINDVAAGKITGALPLANLTDGATTTHALFAGGSGADPAYRAITDADVPNGITIDTATTANTASALAANGTNCPAGQFPLGVDASGNVENCAAASSTSVTVNIDFFDSSSASDNSNSTDDCVNFSNTATTAGRLGRSRIVTLDGFSTLRLIARSSIDSGQGQHTMRIQNITDGTTLASLSSGWTTTCATQAATASISLTGVKQIECQEFGANNNDDPNYSHCAIELIP